MSLVEIFLIAFSLSLDAAVVAVSAGTMKTMTLRSAFKVALFFGVFQAVMPLIGWFAGSYFKEYLLQYGHIIGFVLILLVALKMLKDALSKEEDKKGADLLNTKTLFVLAVATSIDALVIGITFNFVAVSVPLAVSVIGIVAFLMSLLGVYVGKRGRNLFGSKVSVAGAIVLILLAFKVLLF